jgi:hypothetical protein
MSMRTTFFKKILNLTLIFFPAIAHSQTTDILNEAASLHKQYRFEQAIQLYGQALNSGVDSLTALKIGEQIIQCENGLSLLQYAVAPNVLTRREFQTKDFFLHISGLQDKS